MRHDGTRPDGIADPHRDELPDALLAENERLRARVAQLESGLDEYRRQMDQVLTSSSWRVTSPLRLVAGRTRGVRSLPSRWRRRRRQTVRGAPTAGLFPPAAGTTAAHAIARRLAVPPASLRCPRPPRRPREPTAAVLVVAHVYYPEVWLDIADRLARMPEPFDLIVTLVEGKADWLAPGIAGRFPQSLVESVPNLGRDLAPLVSLANRGYLDGYDAVLKVHTKRSPHRLDGDGWRIRLLDQVLPSPAGVRHFLELLRRDADTGIIAPSGSISGPDHWGANRPIVEALASRLPLAFDPDALAVPAGSMFWCRPWVLQRLADLALEPADFQDEAGHTDATTSHALERLIGVLATASGLDLVPADEVPSRLQRRRRPPAPPRVLAFYLPQFHVTPENDRWWGEGFTDWTSVDRARPLFGAQLQPQAPAELGHYDLADPEVMRAQAALAAEYGVAGMVLHHYWFGDETLLGTPLRGLLADPTIAMPFALCWANENWTRRWDGLDEEVLIAQTYPEGWATAFFGDIAPALEDPRYLRVDGRPLLVVYRLGSVPAAAAAVRTWRALAAERGLPGLHVLGVLPSAQFAPVPDDVAAEVDGFVAMPPATGFGRSDITAMTPGLPPDFAGGVLSYQAAATIPGTTTGAGAEVHPGVVPGWDNTARRGSGAWVLHGANPAAFRRWLRRAGAGPTGSGPVPLLFVNAWNEWAEGAHLEPDVRFGRGNLEAVRDAWGGGSGA